MAFINNFLRNHPGAKFEDYIYTCLEQNLQTAFLDELESIWTDAGAYTWRQTDYGKQYHTKWDNPISEAHHTGTGTTTLRDQYHNGETLKEYISTMVHTARKAFPHLKGTPDDPLLNTTYFGPNKRHFHSTWTPVVIKEAALQNLGDRASEPNTRLSWAHLQCFHQVLNVIDSQIGTSSIRELSQNFAKTTKSTSMTPQRSIWTDHTSATWANPSRNSTGSRSEHRMQMETQSSRTSWAGPSPGFLPVRRTSGS